MEGDFKIVHFDEYCMKCEHRKKKEDETPCDECLSNPANVDSHKPVKFEEKKKEDKKEETK